MRILTIVSAIVLSMQLAACSGQDNVAKNVGAEEFHQLIAEKGGQIVDVRTNQEVDRGMIPNAIHIDFYSNDFEDGIDDLDKNMPVFVYCAAGGRSGKAMSMMKDKGFKEVYNLAQGYPSWVSAGFEVKK